MAIEPVVREIVDGDRASLTVIDRDARIPLDLQRGGAAWLADHRSLEHRWVPTAGAPLGWVALIDDVPVGFLLLDVLEVVGRGRVAMVDRVYVLEPAREIGCGDALLAAAEAWARASGCAALEGVALPGDRETKNLYERAGVVARSIIVSKPL
jgi:GNAT superfamily N-acetyltransferase